MKFASVIIPVLNDHDALARCLEALSQQTYPASNYEVVVVDNGSHIYPIDVTVPYSNVRLVKEVKRGSYAARNRGIREARGNIIAFTDADCIPHPDWLRAGIRCLLATEHCGMAGGQIQLTVEDSESPTPCELYDKLKYLDQQRAVTRGHYAATANLFTSKAVVNDVGPFREELLSGGDNEWGKRVYRRGYRQVYCDKAIIRHSARSSFRQLLKKEIRIGGGLAQIDKMKVQTGASAPGHHRKELLRGIFQTMHNSLGVVVGSTARQIPSLSDRVWLGGVIFVMENVRRLERWRVRLGGKPFNL